ncbi:hypothetical protein ANN_17543 [Periplaneta americana]|uniref:Uncharacterized protein n=1 Tax=Periplaneta americana TaxID=6978 RepID=A0ABQ8ST99_PERAM|nr:hypothetical protein ANN_17543 [Periplaneta americana]
MQMNNPFENIASLKSIELLDSSKLLQYENEFPTSASTHGGNIVCFHHASTSLQETYESYFGTISLRTGVERSFSTLKRIETYARSMVSEDRLSGLAVISIEKEMLNQLRQYQLQLLMMQLLRNSSRRSGGWI